MKYLIKNITKDQIILDEVDFAQNFYTRLKGLLGKKDIKSRCGLIIKPCNSIHTIGMKFTIDVAFISNDNRVIHIINQMSPGKISPIIKNSSYCIETKGGQLDDLTLSIGDEIEYISSLEG